MKTAAEIKAELKSSENKEDYLNDLFKENPQLKYINSDVKLRVGGRKAPQTSKEEFKSLLIDSLFNFYEKIEDRDHSLVSYVNPDKNSWTKRDLDYLLDEIIDTHETNESIIKSSKFKKIDKDIRKVELYHENLGLSPWNNDELVISMTKQGIPYITVYVVMDFGNPAEFFIYWDGKEFRAYVPFKGNLINLKTKNLLNGDFDENEDVRYIVNQILPEVSKLYSSDEELYKDFWPVLDCSDRALLETNPDWMREDFESRLEVRD